MARHRSKPLEECTLILNDIVPLYWSNTSSYKDRMQITNTLLQENFTVADCNKLAINFLNCAPASIAKENGYVIKARKQLISKFIKQLPSITLDGIIMEDAAFNRKPPDSVIKIYEKEKINYPTSIIRYMDELFETKNYIVFSRWIIFICCFPQNEENELYDYLKQIASALERRNIINPPPFSDSPTVQKGMSKQRGMLITHMVRPRCTVIGREKDLADTEKLLKEKHVLFLQGMGGIGKSEIAKKYAEDHKADYDTIIFASYTSNFIDLITSEEIPIENVYRAKEETKEEYYRRKLRLLKTLSSERTLLIIDNFNADYDPNLGDIINGPYHLLITSRNKHEPMLHIEKIKDFDKVFEIFKNAFFADGQAAKELTEKEEITVKQILNHPHIDSHTITVELIAKQMIASFIKPEEMLKILSSKGINTGLTEKIDREGETKQSSFDFIRSLFRLTELKEAETHILRCMCLVPYTGIRVHLLKEILELENLDIVNELLKKSWLMTNNEHTSVMLHPVICDVIFPQLNPSPERCPDYFHGLRKKCSDLWFLSREEITAIAPLIFHIYRNWPSPTHDTTADYCKFVSSAWVCGDFEGAQKLGHTVYDFCMKEYGPESEETGTAALQLAGAYFNACDNQAAEPWYETASKYLLAALGPEHELVGVSYSKLGRCHYLKRDFLNAQLYLKNADTIFENLKKHGISEENLPEFNRHYGDNIVEIERYYMAIGEYEKALEYCEKSYKISLEQERFKNGETTSSAYSLADMGICHSFLGNFEQAETFLKRALELNINTQGKTSALAVYTREAMIDNAIRRARAEHTSGQKKAAAIQKKYAQEMMAELMLDLELTFGTNNPKVVSIREKMAQYQ